MPIVEKRYAQALLSSSGGKEEKQLFERGLFDISRLFVSNLQFRKISLDPRLGNNVRINIIKELFPEYNNKIFISFINLLMDKNRMNIIKGISDEYSNLNRLLNNEVNIKIISASSLQEDEVSNITEKYKRLYNADKVTYDLKIDKELLGGVKVIVGNKIYDGSLKTQLRKML